jgi:hypothetical protein
MSERRDPVSGFHLEALSDFYSELGALCELCVKHSFGNSDFPRQERQARQESYGLNILNYLNGLNA